MWRWRDERRFYLGVIVINFKHKLNNLVLIIDYNKIQSYDFIKNVCDLNPLSKKLKSFNFKTFEVNGHDISELEKLLKNKH